MKKKHKYGTHCIICKEEFTPVGSKSHNSKGKCKKCYARWIKTEGYKECQICGRPLVNMQAKPACKMCKLKVKNGIMQSEKYEMSRRTKYYSNRSEKVAQSYELTAEVLDSIKLILTKYKYKFISEIDNLKIASIYTDIWGIDSTLDSLDVIMQLEFMTQRLDKYYREHKDLIYR